MSADRRRHERFAADLPVRVEALESSEVREGTCLNLSEGGILVQVEKPFPRGQEVYVELLLRPIGGALCADAEVAWSMDALAGHEGRPGMGLQFTDLSEEQELLLLAAIGRLEQDSRDPNAHGTISGES